MTIEIITRVPCPTCGGNGLIPSGNTYFGAVELVGCPEQCDGDGTVPRVLATFADAAALWIAAAGARDHGADAVLAALGVTNES